jgi:hypothetical protein
MFWQESPPLGSRGSGADVVLLKTRAHGFSARGQPPAFEGLTAETALRFSARVRREGDAKPNTCVRPGRCRRQCAWGV